MSDKAELIKEGTDPKNRIVSLYKKGSKYQVEKTDTLYISKVLEKKDKAIELFNKQVEDSQ